VKISVAGECTGSEDFNTLRVLKSSTGSVRKVSEGVRVEKLRRDSSL
jgi:hypothetical protein